MSRNGQVPGGAPGNGYARATGGVIYGPPRSRRGRLLNRLRHLFGRDERWEVYSVVGFRDDIDFDANDVKLTITSAGLFNVDDE
jgi:hypothetical protein